MLTEKELEKALDLLTSRLDEVNQFFIAKVAAQVKKIGELNQSSINRLAIMADMARDVREITQMLQTATGYNIRDVLKIYQAALSEMYTDERFSRLLTEKPMSREATERLNHYTQAVAMQTAQTMTNLSNTTAVSQIYRDVVDKAVLAVSSGMGSYTEMMRQSIRDLGQNGMQVYYESGYHRRLDSAVRQNIIDGVNQINQNASIMMGEELGFDAYEISAHARPAPDHAPVQGRVFLKAQFERMQAGLSFSDVDGRQYSGFRRPIGEWNCMHIAMSFSTEHSVRRYTDQQLSTWIADNKKGCKIDGKQYTLYQASQLMRKIETAVRRQKDIANAAREAGDDTLRAECQRHINSLAKKYSAVCAAAGIPARKERMVVEGFKAVKVN